MSINRIETVDRFGTPLAQQVAHQPAADPQPR